MKKFAVLAVFTLIVFATIAEATSGPNVTWPCGGLSWRANEVLTVCWNYSGPQPVRFEIGLSNNGGQSYDYTLATVGPNAREWNGRVANHRPDYPTNGSFNDRVRVRAVMPNGQVVYGNANPQGNFRIAPAQ
ncbi:MAG: hypothetical protein H6508_08310 [Calditrichaeota bacterium]|nr:hypothetical protein [Calditrichota bacterium]